MAAAHVGDGYRADAGQRLGNGIAQRHVVAFVEAIDERAGYRVGRGERGGHFDGGTAHAKVDVAESGEHSANGRALGGSAESHHARTA